MRLSILVVSRTAALLSTLLSSLKDALQLPGEEVEVLCSWNGSAEEESSIENASGYEFVIANRAPYHFARNMNQLAHHANGDVLAFVNDDMTLDRGSLDAGLSCLLSNATTLCVGALLRTPNGQLQHGGMGFDYHNTPYHIAEGIVSATNVISELSPFEVPCVTGALMLIRKSTFCKQPFNESYIRCGEDVELNLDLREKFKGRVMLCPGMSGIHLESFTRTKNNEYGNNSEDLVKMRTRRRSFLEQASSEQLRIELEMAAREQIFTREVIAKERNDLRQQQTALAKERGELRQQQAEQLAKERDYLHKQQVLRGHVNHLQILEQDRDHWKDQTHSLQLARLKLEQKLKQTQRKA